MNINSAVIENKDLGDNFIPYLGWRNNHDNRSLISSKLSASIDGRKESIHFIHKKGSEGKPLIIGFPGYLADVQGQGVFFDFYSSKYIDYPIVTVNDREGFSRNGSWYLGRPLDTGSFSYLHLIPILIQYLREINKPNRVILYGTSMGGFGAFLFSLLCDVDEVYLGVPQTSLSPSNHYFRRDYNNYHKERKPFTSSEYLEYLGLETTQKFLSALEEHPYLDIEYFSNKLLNSNASSVQGKFFKASFSPYYHILATRYDHHQDVTGTYFRDMILPLLTAFSKANVRFSSAIFPFASHDAYIYPESIATYSEDAFFEVKRTANEGRKIAIDCLTKSPYWAPFCCVAPQSGIYF